MLCPSVCCYCLCSGGRGCSSSHHLSNLHSSSQRSFIPLSLTSTFQARQQQQHMILTICVKLLLLLSLFFSLSWLLCHPILYHHQELLLCVCAFVDAVFSFHFYFSFLFSWVIASSVTTHTTHHSSAFQLSNYWISVLSVYLILSDTHTDSFNSMAFVL